MREIATFHGEMYALKSSNLKVFNGIAAQLKEARIANGYIIEEYNTKLVTCRLRVVNAVKEMFSEKEVPADFLEMFLTYTADPYTCFKKQFQAREPLAIVIHGDYLRNNIAYKFNVSDTVDSGNDFIYINYILKGTDEPVDVMMYDFQTMRYASPMLDLSLLLNVSASHEVRSNFDQIFNFYYETLVKSFCDKMGSSDIPSYLSSDALLKDYAFCFPNSILIAASFLPLLYTPIEIEGSIFDAPPLTHEEQVKEAMERGGALLDKELAHMMHEFYQLCNKFEIEFD